MKTVGILVLSLLLLPSCVTSMRVSQTRQFGLSIDTPITVSVQNDYAGVQGRVEAKLLELGFNVVPVDVARKALELKQSIETGGSTATSKASLESSIYFPTALIVSVAYQTRSDMVMQGFTFFNARFIDLSTQRVLGVATFSQGANWLTMDYTINSFAEEVAKYVK